ncbi:MAG: branched-chain amino acid ABC transporter permease, partial [Acidimicrobiia bacterium]
GGVRGRRSVRVRHGHPPGLLLAMAVAVAVCVAGGWLVGVIALRFRGLEFAIASVAVGAVLSEFVVTRGGIQTNVANAQLFGWDLLDSRNLFAVMLLATALCMILVRNIRRSGWGRNLAMMREMHIRVGHFGVAPLRSEGALLAVSAGLAGLAGCFLALTITLDPFVFVPLVSVTLVLAAVVGGLQSLWGPVVTGLVFGVGQEVVGRVFSQESANAFPQIAGALLAIVLIVGMPNGLSSLFSWAREVAGRIPAHPDIRFRGRDVPALLAPAPRGAAQASSNGHAHPGPRARDTAPEFQLASQSERVAAEGRN